MTYILLFLYNIFYNIDINKYGLLEEKFNKNGRVDTLINAFQMPEELPKED